MEAQRRLRTGLLRAARRPTIVDFLARTDRAIAPEAEARKPARLCRDSVQLIHANRTRDQSSISRPFAATVKSCGDSPNVKLADQQHSERSEHRMREQT